MSSARYTPLGRAFLGRYCALILDNQTGRIVRVHKRHGSWLNHGAMDALITDKALIRVARKVLA